MSRLTTNGHRSHTSLWCITTTTQCFWSRFLAVGLLALRWMGDDSSGEPNETTQRRNFASQRTPDQLNTGFREDILAEQSSSGIVTVCGSATTMGESSPPPPTPKCVLLRSPITAGRQFTNSTQWIHFEIDGCQYRPHETWFELWSARMHSIQDQLTRFDRCRGLPTGEVRYIKILIGNCGLSQWIFQKLAADFANEIHWLHDFLNSIYLNLWNFIPLQWISLRWHSRFVVVTNTTETRVATNERLTSTCSLFNKERQNHPKKKL